MSDFDSLISEAEAHPVEGWDFSWLGERLTTAPMAEDYEQFVLQRARNSADLLDMGTGGGEWLSRLGYLPPRTVATESWLPNVSVAHARLGPMGVKVVRVEPAPDNSSQEVSEQRGRLPFSVESFHLVNNRHESFLASEVARILVAGGRFVTRQVGGEGSYEEAQEALRGLRPATKRPWNLSEALKQLEAAGLRVRESGEGTEVVLFADVGALAWYLKAIPWIIPGYEITKYRDRLAEVHSQIQAKGPFKLSMTGFWLEAVKEPLPAQDGQ